MFNQAFIGIAEKIINAHVEISWDQAMMIAQAGPHETPDLIALAGKIRQRFHSPRFLNARLSMPKADCARKIVRFALNLLTIIRMLKTYELLSAQNLEQAGLAMAAAGASNYSVVTSGTSLTDADIETVCQVARRLKAKTDLTLCGSVGLLTPEAARRLKHAGISRYHHNLETARSHFDQICSTHDYDDDIDTVKTAKAAGMVVCSGGIFGMGESWAQRVELAFTLKELGVDSVPINFLNPIEGTRLEQQALLPPMEALKIIALYRFIHPRKDITVCGGREATLKDFQSWIFSAGANGLMIGNYLTTQGRNIDMDLDMIEALGLSGS